MINLLPDDTKKELRAARTNVVLLRYNIATLTALILLAGFCGLFYVLLSDMKTRAIAKNEENTTRAVSYKSTEKEAASYRENLRVAKTILDKEVAYTDVIFAITKILPKGVVLDNLTLNAKDFGSQTILTAYAKDYAAVNALKNNFENSTIFENVFYQTITDTAAEGGTPGDPAHPITVNISVKIKKVTK